MFVGEEAVFQCKHPTTDWRVNGTLLGHPPPPDIILGTEDGTLVETLTVIAYPQYNGTVVECEAVFRSAPPELSPAVVLQGNCEYTVTVLKLRYTQLDVYIFIAKLLVR